MVGKIVTKRNLMVLCVVILWCVVMKIALILTETSSKEAGIRALLSSRSTEDWVKPGENTVRIDSLPASARILRILKRKPPFAVVLVMSHFNNVSERQAIRETWYKWSPSVDIAVVFFLGSPPTADLRSLSHEIVTNNDIIIDDLEDSPYVRPVKLLRALKWFLGIYPDADFRPKFLIKVDLDVFVNLRNLAQHLNDTLMNENDDYYISGAIRAGFPAFLDPRDQAGQFMVPTYLASGIYAFKATTAAAVYKAALNEPVVTIPEEAWVTGYVAHRMNASLSRLGANASHVLELEQSSLSYPLLGRANYRGSQWDPVKGIAFQPAGRTLMQSFYKICSRASQSYYSFSSAESLQQD